MASLTTLRKYIREALLAEDMTRDDLEGASDIDWVDAAWHQPDLFLGTSMRTEGLRRRRFQEISLVRQQPKPQNVPDVAGPQFTAMQRAAEEFGLTKISMGSSRIVYDRGDGTVLKLARNTKGLAQNSVEAFAGRDPMINRVVAGVEKYSDEFAWLVSQKVEQLGSQKEFENLTGIPWVDLRAAIGRPATSADAATVTAKPQAGSKSGGGKTQGGGGAGCLRGDEFVQYLKDYLARYTGMLPGDLLKYDSWGRTAGGCVVLLDYGISEATFNKLYKRK